MPSERDVEVVTADGPMGLFETEPDHLGAARGAVVVLQEAFGVNDHIKEVARRLAAGGYHAAVPHLFHRSGDPVIAYEDYQEAPAHMEALGDPGILADVDATVDHLERADFGPKRIGVVGFCMGGRATFLVASSRSLGAAVTFYGAAITRARSAWMPALIDRAQDLATPWLGLFGDEDPAIPVEDVETLRAALRDAPVEAEIVRYPDAGHGFFCEGRDSYRADAAEDAWRRTLAFFDRHLA